jgi:hypothetical protein
MTLMTIKHGAALLAIIALLPAPLAAQATAPAPAPAARSTSGQVVDSAGRIAQQPLRDLNIVRDGIPPEIEAIMAEPYSLKGLRGCPDYAAEIKRLTAVLGPDVDSPEARAAAETSTEFVLGTAESVVGSLIPGMGIIRRVSGAQAAQKRAQAAVLAGQLRRAFIKGRANGRGCRA